MLVTSVSGEPNLGGMVKDSGFYIEVAKFVQAYTTIVSNPNEFLAEIKEQSIDEKKEKLSWDQFVKIMQTCDLGFKKVPTREELVVYYNYALQIGSINYTEKKLATIDEVADAQKQYYNFVDAATDRAETEYLRQKRVTDMRNQEIGIVDGKLTGLKVKNYLCIVMMMFAVVMFSFGAVSFFVSNKLAEAIGSIIPVWEKRFIGGIILIFVSIIIFTIFDKLYISTKTGYAKLKQASATIFDRVDENYLVEKDLKRKLTSLKKDLKGVKKELADKHKRFDVKANIDKLKVSNKYYKRLCENEEELSFAVATESGNDEKSMLAEDFAPVKLTKEQEENLRTVNKEVIRLEGEFDVEAYNEKFENVKDEEKEKEAEQKTDEQQQEEDLMESIDYIKNMLGMVQEEADPEKQK